MRTMPIRVLAPEVANQIAAGEVVERPASAIKELIENSLDAGATEIRVEVREGGRRLIRVQDDGCGIPADELTTAFLRHATSKISDAGDLERITTLGFRGEALASIAAVSHVSLLSRTADQDAGALIRVAEGREIERSIAGAPVGTSITVEHLFANVPARLKFLKQPATEAAHIQQVVTRYALAYPERRFSLVSDGRLLFQSTGSGQLFDVLAKAYGLDTARQMIRVGEEGGRVTGYTGVPSLHRGSRSYITLFVNRRWFHDTSVSYAVIQAYHTLLPVGRYPVAVLFLSVEPGDVDVNVHPTKAEIRFRDPNAIFGAAQKAVRRALVENAPIPEAGSTATTLPGAWPQESPLNADDPLRAWTERREALLNLGRGVQTTMPLPRAEESRSSDIRGVSSGLQEQTVPARLMPILRVVGQLAATYIVAEGPDGMYLIDQHAAHERILYEQMLAERVQQQIPVQPLLEPAVLDLSPEVAAIAADSLAQLADLGVMLEPFGGASYLLRSVPAILAREGQPERAVIEILDGLARQDDVVDSAAEARLVTLICKRAAVKGNTPMLLPEMQELVRRLEDCRSPRTCPHGRPTMVYMSATELAKQFLRP
jgi:DNA mismatch repair protein MutL